MKRMVASKFWIQQRHDDDPYIDDLHLAYPGVGNDMERALTVIMDWDIDHFEARSA